LCNIYIFLIDYSLHICRVAEQELEQDVIPMSASAWLPLAEFSIRKPRFPLAEDVGSNSKPN